MNIKVQLLSFLVSFLYGIFTFFCYNFVFKFLSFKKYIYNIITNFLFVMLIMLLYFFIMFIINSAVIHTYFLFAFAFAFLMSRYVYIMYRSAKTLKK